MTKAELAVEYKHNGHNCAQSVLLAYKEELKKSEAELDAIGSGFGSGMGGMEATCGALIGAVMVKGMLNNTDSLTKLIPNEMLQGFKETCGAIACCDLKGVGTGKVLCACDDCIRNAIGELEKQ